jgi:hypothetical protein
MASGVALTVVLAAFVAAHGILIAGLARRRAWRRAVVALVVPPLAPWWGWGAGLRLPTIVWCAALALYAAGALALAG